MSAPRPAKAGRPPRGSSKVAKPHFLESPPERSLAQQVVAWQRQHGRHGLPWQGLSDPYPVWLSEVMLQQTQVSTVLGYYARFMQRFPDVASLAAAPLDDVLAAWSGLGYYSRARNLHRCAQAVVALHGGRFPRSSAGLAELPGIGPSTAAAIAAFCYGERAAILDGNVKRLLSRVFAFGGDLAERAQEQALLALAQQALPAQRDMPAYTQGLMDLGATVCTQRAPACTRCPLAQRCQAHALGQEVAFPVRTRKLKRSQRSNAWLCLRQGSKTWLVQRPPSGVWGGLLSLPEFESVPALLAQAQALGWPGRAEPLPAIRHTLTHFDWELLPVRWRLPARLPAAQRLTIESTWPKGQWVGDDEVLERALPAPLRKLLSASGSQDSSPTTPLPRR